MKHTHATTDQLAESFHEGKRWGINAESICCLEEMKATGRYSAGD
jgi:hypothetical protein